MMRTTSCSLKNTYKIKDQNLDVIISNVNTLRVETLDDCLVGDGWMD